MKKTAMLKCSLAIAAAGMFITSIHAQNAKPSKYIPTDPHYSRNNQYLHISEDSSAKPAQTIVSYKDAHDTYDFTFAADRITEMYIDDRKIPADSFYLYGDLVTMANKQLKSDKLHAEFDRQQAERDSKQAELDRRSAAHDDEHAAVDRNKAEEDRAMMENLLSDIVKEHITPDKKSIASITLSGDEFVVNGKLQPGEVFEKFKEKYIKKPGYSFSYTGDATNYTFRYSGKDDSKNKK
ncbi:MAG TPA: hypothetical protein VG738_08185 [Chitinophagaceae bacterium]|nr:hypothetical protein [Chitinophagaceae bacterium]